MGGGIKESGRFLKKAAQKLLRLLAGGRETSTALGQSVKARGRLLFVNKKKQKNFIYSGLWALSATQTQAPLSQEFLRRFF
jgi:hypothetical protein